jgi:hypothetical protein
MYKVKWLRIITEKDHLNSIRLLMGRPDIIALFWKSSSSSNGLPFEGI